MRKWILVILILSGTAVARDPVDAERAALRKKLTRLAKVRKSLPAAQPQPALEMTPPMITPASRNPQPITGAKKVPAEPAAQQRGADQFVPVEKSPKPVRRLALAGPANPASPVNVDTDVAPAQTVINSSTTAERANGKQEVSLGEIARRYRAQKRQQHSSSH